HREHPDDDVRQPPRDRGERRGVRWRVVKVDRTVRMHRPTVRHRLPEVLGIGQSVEPWSKLSGPVPVELVGEVGAPVRHGSHDARTTGQKRSSDVRRIRAFSHSVDEVVAPVVAAPDPTPDPALRDAADIARELGVDPAVGLSTAEAARRLRVDGPNELRAKPPLPGWRRFLAQFQDPLVYLLLVAVAISLLAWAAEGARGVPIDAVVISVVLMLNAVLGFVEEHRAENAVAALQSMTEARATVLRDGRLTTVPSHELVRGDILVLNEGDAGG